MEHLVRLASSNAFFHATVFGFTFWVILWFVWARFFHESVAFHKVCQFVLAFVLLMFFFALYASVVADGLDGVVCASGRFTIHVTCHSHDESPGLFWALVVWLLSIFVLFMLMALAFLLKMLVPGDKGLVARGGNRRRSIGTGERRSAGRARGWTAFQALQFACGVIVISNLAWIAKSLHQVSVARRQVDEALASASGATAAVEAYLRDHGALPEDSRALGLLSPVSLHSQYVSEVRIHQGSIWLTFDETATDKHLGGRSLILIALRRGSHVAWHCASRDIVERYLAGICPVGS